MPKELIFEPLENEQHEIFARALAVGNEPLTCYLVAGYKKNAAAAKAMSKLDHIKRRAEGYYSARSPNYYRKHGWRHPLSRSVKKTVRYPLDTDD